MAIARVGTPTSNEATTVTIPAGHAAGHLMVVWAWRDGSTTNPTVPAGWTTITNTTDGTTCSISMGWKWAVSGAETSGTWTNATSTACHVYRGVDPINPVGAVVGTAGTTSPYTFGAVTLRNTSTSWIAAFIGHRSVDTTTITTAPTSMTNQSSTLGATSDVASHDTNGPYTAGITYAANTVAPGGTDSGVITAMLEIIAENATTINNYQFADASSSNAGIISVGEKIK